METPARVAGADKDIYSTRFTGPESGMGGLAAAPQHRESSKDRCRDREVIPCICLNHIPLTLVLFSQLSCVSNCNKTKNIVLYQANNGVV